MSDISTAQAAKPGPPPSESRIPEGVAQPQDHLQPTEPPKITDDELLDGMPELTPPHKLRLRQRNKIMKLALSMRSFISKDADAEAEPVEIDFEDLSDDDLEKMLDLLASVDEFAESIAADQPAYVEWAQAADYDKFSALLSRYSSAVGESSSSSS